MDESTPTDATTPVEPDVAKGQAPEPESKADGKTFDEGYVKTLRKEAADNRKALAETTKRLQELEDRDKSEAEKQAARVAESERRASEAEAKLLRLEVAAARNLAANAVPLLHGTTREEIEASADLLATVLKESEPRIPGFDGGARTTPPEKKAPEVAHNEWLLRAMGVTRE